MHATEHEFFTDIGRVRVVIADDVIALPLHGWSCYGFGRSIDADWLLLSAHFALPGDQAARRILANCIVDALEDRRMGVRT